MRRRWLLLNFLFLVPSVGWSAGRPNVLFIMADDLRVELGCYGSVAQTPNLDALAKLGMRFDRAYCQQALCNPSRSSMLTGLRPDTTGLWCNGLHFRDLLPEVVTMPGWFKQEGYQTRCVGKIFHNWHTKVKGDRQSWSADEFLHYATHYDDEPQMPAPVPKNEAAAPKCDRRPTPDQAYYDGRVAQEAIRVLGEVKDQPFFLGVGFWKPHSPFNAPKQYWDQVPPGSVPALNPARPTAPAVAFHDGRELRGIPPEQVTFTPTEIQEIRHGYFANIRYMDEQVGKVLAELDRLKLRKSTIIVFVADHGYHLGEHGLWAKTSCFELDARVPLLIVDPRTQQAGAKTEALVELVDLFPTLTELCGLPAPPKLDGASLAPVLADPTKRVKAGALSQHPRPAYFDRTPSGVPEAIGYSVRTQRVRYAEWRDWLTGAVVGRELYDHTTDPQELNNIVDAPTSAAWIAEAQPLLPAARPRPVVSAPTKMP